MSDVTDTPLKPSNPVSSRFFGWDLQSRVLAVALTVGLVLWLQEWTHWVGLVISFGFAHYLLSLYYARRRIRELASSSAMLVPMVGLAMALLLVLFMEFPLEIYFGLHHACNEAYLRRYQQRDGSGSEFGGGAVAAARGLFHFGAYLVIVRGDPEIAQLGASLAWIVFGLGGLVLVVQLGLWGRAAGLRAGALLRDSSVECLMLLGVLCSLVWPISFLQAVMYHFVLWTIVPLPMMRAQGRGALLEYGLLTVGSLLFFLVLAFTQALGGRASMTLLYGQFYFWSYAHITTSFALSPAHPAWVRRLFQVPART